MEYDREGEFVFTAKPRCFPPRKWVKQTLRGGPVSAVAAVPFGSAFGRLETAQRMALGSVRPVLSRMIGRAPADRRQREAEHLTPGA